MGDKAGKNIRTLRTYILLFINNNNNNNKLYNILNVLTFTFDAVYRVRTVGTVESFLNAVFV